MAERPSSMNFYSLTWTMLLSGEITNTLAVRLKAESFAKQITINLNLSKACWQIRKNITACEVQFQRFNFLWYRFDLLRFQNIPGRHHRYLKCWQHVVNALNISQSYFCVVRAMHNSNSLGLDCSPSFRALLAPSISSGHFFSQFSFASRMTD